MGLKRSRLILIVVIFWVQAITNVWGKTGNITAFVHVNLVPMTKEIIIPDQTVLVKGSRIITIGQSGSIDIPEDSIVINGSNKYLLPGLADMHMHTATNWLKGNWPVSPFHLYLANGVTTIRNFGPKGRSPDNVLHWRKIIKKKDFPGPSIYSCGEQIRGFIDNPEEMVHEQKEKGFDFIKFYSYLSKDEFSRAVSEARNLGLYTAGHIPFQVGLADVLSKGMDEIAHIEELFWEFVDFDRNRHFNNENEWMSYVIGKTFQQYKPYLNSEMQEIEEALSDKMALVAQKLKSKNIPVCTTLFLDDVIVEKLFKPEKFLLRPENKYLPGNYLNALRQGREKHQRQFYGGEVFAPFKRRVDLMLLHHLKAAGVSLILATDAGGGGMGLVPGFSVHQELQVLTQNGFTPYEAIKTATINAANAVENMIGEKDFGTIEKGKRADLILVKGNPFNDIKFLSSLQGVMANGRWYDKTSLKRMIKPGLPAMGAIHHVYEANGKSSTYFEIIIGKNFKGKLPRDIKSIAIFGPKGKLSIAKDDFIYSPGLRYFWMKIPGIPEKGTYRFEVKSDEDSCSTFDYQHEVRTISHPDSTTFKPGNGADLYSSTPTFTWAAVREDIPLYYRLEINSLHGDRVYSTKRYKNMLSHKIIAGVLKKGQSYRWRLRVTDSDDWLNVQNRSHTGWQIFNIR